MTDITPDGPPGVAHGVVEHRPARETLPLAERAECLAGAAATSRGSPRGTGLGRGPAALTGAHEAGAVALAPAALAVTVGTRGFRGAAA
ncbi:hypothetical protein WDA79_19560 [Streptomyces sp. A475]|uniref:hypothetical protein n=1 Tax=unclassified Streptomyces TaxID=2593676 RepID=UPI0030C9CA75